MARSPSIFLARGWDDLDLVMTLRRRPNGRGSGANADAA
jgi:hypothetical protein